jgi:hypothetical protein
MKSKAGLWIDTKKAVIVIITDKKIEKKLIESNVDTQLGRIDGVRSTTRFESRLVPPDDNHERDLTGHLNKYYDEVISCIHDAESILIFGPGETKGKLLKHMGKTKSNIIIETTDKMTDRQIVAKVQKYFQKQQDE